MCSDIRRGARVRITSAYLSSFAGRIGIVIRVGREIIRVEIGGIEYGFLPEEIEACR